ncbi:MAG: MvdC/MvdD family ATP grasp protein [Trueperaceae bacterium]
MPSTIVIVTKEIDPHADRVILQLLRQGIEPVRLHTSDFPKQASLSLELDSSTEAWQGQIYSVEGRSIDVSDVRSIWWRRPGKFQFPDTLSEEEATFADQEMDKALRGLWASFQAYWISHPDDVRRASYKLEQLQRAKRMGFAIPKTLVTMHPDKVQDFYTAHQGNIIYKPFSQISFKNEIGAPILGIYTTPVTPKLLEQIESVQTAPSLFQEYVPKDVELRVTVVGNRVFSAAIHSQQATSEDMKVDWRHYENVPYTKVDLPTEVERRCLEYVHSYNLNYSALDFVLTPDGRYVFLENNPNGQWGFVQNAVPELKIGEAITECLIAGQRL